jgi:nicotinate phosphoribosyltransferase
MLPPHTPPHDQADDLLVRVMDRGRLVAPLPDLEAARARAAGELAALSSRTKRFLNPQPYPVGLDHHVHARKMTMIAEASHA